MTDPTCTVNPSALPETRQAIADAKAAISAAKAGLVTQCCGRPWNTTGRCCHKAIVTLTEGFARGAKAAPALGLAWTGVR